MPEALTVFLWVASVSLALIAALIVALLAALVAAVLELRALARGIGQEVRWVREQRRYLSNRTRFAGKWLRIMGQRLMS